MDYQLRFIIKDERKDLLNIGLRYFCAIGGVIGGVGDILSRTIFDIILYPLFYLFAISIIIAVILKGIGLKKDIGIVSLRTNGSILITATQETEKLLHLTDLQTIAIHYDSAYDAWGDKWIGNPYRDNTIAGNDNTIRITTTSGEVLQYFFLSKHKEDLEYINELVNDWQALGINVVLTKNEKYNKNS